MSIVAGTAIVNADGTYTATALAKILFEYRYLEIVGDLTFPSGLSASQKFAIVNLLKQEADRCVRSANDLVEKLKGVAVGGSNPPIPLVKSDTTPAGGGLVIALQLTGGSMTDTPNPPGPPTHPVLTFNAAAQSVERDTGSFTLDGFHAGHVAVIAGTASNNGSRTIVSVTPAKMTFASGIVNEASAASASITSTSTTLGTWSRDGANAIV